MVEFGTAAHVIHAAPGHALAFGGGTVREVHHPGSQKCPSMRPAFDGRAEEAVQAVAAYLAERIEREQFDNADPNS